MLTGRRLFRGATLSDTLAAVLKDEPEWDHVVFPSRGSDGQQRLSIRQLNEAKATTLAGTEDAADPFFSPDSQWIGFFANGKIRKISVSGGAPFTLSEAPNMRGASWGVDGNIIAALNTGGGLYRITAAGGTPQPLTTNPANKKELTHRWPQILPGGEAVLFTANTNAINFEIANISLLSLKTGQWKTVQRGGYFGRYVPTGHLLYIHQGTLFGVKFDAARGEVEGTPVPLLDDVQANPAVGGGQFDFSQAGTLVYLSGRSVSESHTIAWLDMAGKIQPLLDTPGGYLQPRLSPDGKLLALSVDAGSSLGMSVYDLQQRTMNKISLGMQARTTPIWTPDSKHIVYGSRQDGAYIMWWIRTDGSGAPQKLLENKDPLVPGSFSPDGRRLAYSMGRDLWTLPLDTSDPDHPKPGTPELFLQTPAAKWDPAFSPDGRWIAYNSAETDVYEVYVQPFQAPGAPSGSSRQISSGGGQFPIWSRDGRELLYQTLDGHVMEVAYRVQGSSFAPEQSRPWPGQPILLMGNWSSFDLSPDGQRLVVFPRPEAAASQTTVHVTFLLNFFDELRRRVPTR